MLSANTNLQSLVAQRIFADTNKAMSNTMEKISTGLRINSFKDDAAGAAISNRMTAQINGYNAAIRNTNDGISFLQTAESSLGNIEDSLQRVRELTVQAANETNSEGDRTTIKAEIDQLVSDIDRIAKGAEYNGINLLDGSFSSKSFQIGANDGDTLSVDNMLDARAAVLGGHTLTGSGTITGKVVSGAVVNSMTAETDLTLTTDKGTSGAISYAANASAKDIASAINGKAGAVGVSATAQNSVTLSDLSANAAGETVSFTINGKAVSAVVDDPSDLSAVAAAINGQSGDTGIVAEFTDSDSKDSLTLSTTDGRNVAIGAFAVTTVDATVDFGGTELDETGDIAAVKTGTVSLVSSAGQMITDGASAQVFATADTNISAFSSVSFMDFSDTSGIEKSISTIDAAIAQVSSGMANLGAYQNRFESVINSLNSASENATSSRSRIMDADMAKESANLTKSQILQQISGSMLAQANAQPQMILQLLR